MKEKVKKNLRSLWISALLRIDEQFSAIEDFGERANSKRVSEFGKSRARGNWHQESANDLSRGSLI